MPVYRWGEFAHPLPGGKQDSRDTLPGRKGLELGIATPFSLFGKDLLKRVDLHSLEYPINCVGISSCAGFRFNQRLCGNHDKASRAIGERTGEDNLSFGIQGFHSR
jgi:hypothetical protein